MRYLHAVSISLACTLDILFHTLFHFSPYECFHFDFCPATISSPPPSAGDCDMDMTDLTQPTIRTVSVPVAKTSASAKNEILESLSHLSPAIAAMYLVSQHPLFWQIVDCTDPDGLTTTSAWSQSHCEIINKTPLTSFFVPQKIDIGRLQSTRACFAGELIAKRHQFEQDPIISEIFDNLAFYYNVVSTIIAASWTEVWAKAGKESYPGWRQNKSDTRYDMLFSTNPLFTGFSHAEAPRVDRSAIANALASRNRGLTSQQPPGEPTFSAFITLPDTIIVITSSDHDLWYLAQMNDNQRKYESLAKEHDLSNIRVITPYILNADSVTVHPSDYHNVFMPGTQFAVLFWVRFADFGTPTGHLNISMLNELPSTTAQLHKFYNVIFRDYPNSPPSPCKRPHGSDNDNLRSDTEDSHSDSDGAPSPSKKLKGVAKNTCAGCSSSTRASKNCK
ncbi:hypothetical protein D9758_017595 [Tetrapyrgos nigripes]|uniref:Uncharacterized protein n=1 Tax=Tetrapyrgos nigripes TaxID=182062 RepID=A0A8H5C2C4_9AGAR|nr:hypothetical protein D9758_017595 [Tetrapyrgos nigripes]